MSTDRFQSELADALHRDLDDISVDTGRALAGFPHRLALARRRRRRQGLALAATAATVVLVAVVLPGTAARRADQPVDRPDRVVTVEPRGARAIALGAGPSRVVLQDSTVWAALGTGSLARIDVATGAVSRIGALPSMPFDIQPTSRWIWVSMPNAHQIVALDPADGAVVHTVDTPAPGPRGMALSDGALWATAGTELLGLDPRTGRGFRAVPLPDVGLPYDVAVSSDSAWVTDSRGTAISRYRLDGSGLEQIEVGAHSVGIVVSAGSVWIALLDASRLVRLDAATGRVQSSPKLPSPALGLSVIGHEVWAGLPDIDQVMSFDAATGKPTRRWHVGDYPPIVTGDRDTIYISSNRSHQLISVPTDENR